MHELVLGLIIKCCRQRQAEGDCPTVTAFPVEQLEDAVVQLADKLEKIQPLLPGARAAIEEDLAGTPATRSAYVGSFAETGLGICRWCGKSTSPTSNCCARCADERGP
jgi:hypothetical protein